ncbi:CbtA family protein [Rubrobacter aplysinae]|uniref:CbtA family protein n=1 Tax=Rubrobacter aplysinae TaxID=909625 RepID=UPI00064B8CEB|nr:CbtA family protein [Rubrobacter aplysinae]
MTTSYLRRGLAAGLLAGLLAGVFAFFVGESSLEGAIQLEEASSGGAPEEEVFSRSTQKVGLFFATGLTGLAVGGLFGLAYAYFRPRMASVSDWRSSLSLSAAVFAGAILLPFLKYPANPPTVGGPETIGARTAAYFTMVILSLLAVLVAWYVARRLREREVSPPVRHTAVGVGFAVIVAGLFMGLPAAVDPGGFPAGLLWDFRLSALGTQLVLWAALGCIFGALCEWTDREGDSSPRVSDLS